MTEETVGSITEDISAERTEQQPRTEEKPRNSGLVDMTLSSGVAPIELRFSQINHCARRLPIAYRSYTYINSVTEGVIPPEKYGVSIENSEIGLRIAKWNVIHIIRVLKAFEAAGRDVSFISARCPAHICDLPDIYAWLKEIFEAEDFKTPQKLCLEFPRSVLYEDMEKVRNTLINVSLTKCRTMLAGCGAPDCPFTPLINLPFDFALLSPWLTSNITDRNKGSQISEIISLLAAFRIEVIGEGAADDDQLTALSRADCFGYIPSPDYEGGVLHGRLRMTAAEAISQKEEEF